MAGSPSTYENLKSIPLAVEFSWRGKNNGTVQADAWAKNVFIEKDSDSVYSVKRPGLQSAGTLTGTVYANYQIQCLVLEVYFGGPAAGFAVTNDHYLPLLTGAGALNVPLPANGYQIANAWYTSHSINVQSASVATTPFFAVMSSAWGIALGQWHYNAGAHLFYKSFSTVNTPSGAYQLVPGIASLDSTWYILDSRGILWASALGDPSTWPALNYTSIDQAIGAPVSVIQYNSYIVTFGTQGTQLWYDAGISPGSPLAGVQGGVYSVGMASIAAFSLAKSESSLLWVGSSSEGNLAVFRLTGTAIDKISNASVDRYLAAYFSTAAQFTVAASSISIRGSICRVSGHEFYILTYISPSAAAVGTGGTTLVYDTGTGGWYVWTQQTSFAYGEGGLRAWQALSVPAGPTYMPDMVSGAVYQLSDTQYQDDTQVINVLLQTDNHNWGNMRTKFIPATYPLLDTTASTVSLSWSDDDYTTFNTPQAISTSAAKKQLLRCGSTVQRAWQLTHTDNAPMRFFSLEVEVVPGAL